MRYIFLVSLLMCGMTVAGEIKVIPSPQKASRDTGLELVVERIEISTGRLEIQGTVENTGSQVAGFVRVFLTIKDAGGNFITRGDYLVDPSEIGPGEVGYLDRRIDVKGKTPGIVEYTVVNDV